MTKQNSSILIGLMLMTFSLFFMAQFAEIFKTITLSEMTAPHYVISFFIITCFSSGVILFGNSDES